MYAKTINEKKDAFPMKKNTEKLVMQKENEVAKKTPKEKALFLFQMAESKYIIGNYKSAINYYIQAMENGADEDAMDDCIWQSFQKAYEVNKDEYFVKKYFDWVPSGAYQAEANALLIGHYS